MTTAEGELHDSIMEDNAYFKRMLDLIPPHVYFSQETKQQMFTKLEQSEEGSQQGDGATKKKKKKKSKERVKKAPNVFRNQLVSRIQEDLFTNSSSNFTDVKSLEPDSSGQTAMPKPLPITPVASGSADIDDKRARLRAKIEELQAKRKLTDTEMIQRKRLKRQESRMKLKQRRKEMRQQGTSEPDKGGNKNKGGNPAVTRTPTKTPTKPIYNKDGQVVFSKFDFTDSGKKEKKQSSFKGKDYKRLLDKIEKRNQKINKLKNKDEKAAQSLQDKFKWDTAIQKAQGEKVKDNPEILKKSLKRKEKLKEKRKKKWENRVETVQKQKDARQEKRNKHIQERKNAKKEKKMNRMKKKGRIIPGF